MDQSTWQDQSPHKLVLDRAALPVLIITSVITLALVLPFVPTGFIPLLPALPLVAVHLFERGRWKKELRALISPPQDERD